MAASWTASLWARVETVFAAILDHPFLRGLTDGTLDPAAFGFYVAQDAHYLRDYARALALVAAKAPTHADAAVLARHAAETAEVELVLHETLLPELGVDGAAIPPGPTTTAYTSYLLATGYGGCFGEALAAVLPCYWIYQRVGETLVRSGSPDPRYQRWIDTYAGEAFASSVAEVLTIADRTGPSLGPDEGHRAAAHFETTSRYEWMFWDAAWRQETWPP